MTTTPTKQPATSIAVIRAAKRLIDGDVVTIKRLAELAGIKYTTMRNMLDSGETNKSLIAVDQLRRAVKTIQENPPHKQT